MLETASELTAAAGYERYEISNWARPGFRCRHNLDCWSLGEYRGFGAGAHSFLRRPGPRAARERARPGRVRPADPAGAATRSRCARSPPRASSRAKR